MKKILAFLFIFCGCFSFLSMCCAMDSYAQEPQSFTLNGKTFVQQTTKHTKDTLQTDYSWQDSKGVNYPIVVNKSSGRCYIWKTSSKTNKLYKMYLKEDVSRKVCSLLGIQYVEKQSK